MSRTFLGLRESEFNDRRDRLRVEWSSGRVLVGREPRAESQVENPTASAIQQPGLHGSHHWWITPQPSPPWFVRGLIGGWNQRVWRWGTHSEERSQHIAITLVST